MSGIGFSELILLFIIGLLILGPERLPRVASQIGRWVGRARRTANQLRYQLEREIALADIEKAAREDKKNHRDPPADQASSDDEASGSAESTTDNGAADSAEASAEEAGDDERQQA